MFIHKVWTYVQLISQNVVLLRIFIERVLIPIVYASDPPWTTVYTIYMVAVTPANTETIFVLLIGIYKVTNLNRVK